MTILISPWARATVANAATAPAVRSPRHTFLNKRRLFRESASVSALCEPNVRTVVQWGKAGLRRSLGGLPSPGAWQDPWCIRDVFSPSRARMTEPTAFEADRHP